VDLRLPLSSSIAVVRLKHADAAAAGAPPPAAAAAAAAGGDGALQLPTAGSAPHDLDAWATRVVVQPPDACQTFVQKNGHFKVREWALCVRGGQGGERRQQALLAWGVDTLSSHAAVLAASIQGVLIWHAAKASTILKALLQQEMDAEQQQQHEPPQQHTHQQRSRRCVGAGWRACARPCLADTDARRVCAHASRSDAWEEWAEWSLEQQEQQQQQAEDVGRAAGGTCSVLSPVLSPASQVSNLLRSCFTTLRGHSSGGGDSQQREQGGNSSSSDVSTSGSLSGDACCILQAAPRPSVSNKQAGCSVAAPEAGATSKAPPPAARHCLVFSYACDLNWCHTL
jgi:hypothetical protein